ncbi:MAG TPA: hypothetical protein VIL13_13855 [Longimicrobiales bacterium]|jgi:hypothetical protein
MNEDRELERFGDEALREALRAALPEPPLEEVDWEGLHGRIMANVRPWFARAPRRQWWEFLAGWAGRGVPVAASAAAAAAVVVGFGLVSAVGDQGGEVVVPPAGAVVEEELATALPEGVYRLLASEAGEDALLDVVFYEHEEGW